MKPYHTYSICLALLLVVSCESPTSIGVLRSIEISKDIERSNLPKESTPTAIVKTANYYYTTIGNLYFREFDAKTWKTVTLPQEVSGIEWNVANIYKDPGSDRVYCALIQKEGAKSRILILNDPIDSKQNILLEAAPPKGQVLLILGVYSDKIYVLHVNEDTKYNVHSVNITNGTFSDPLAETNKIKRVAHSMDLFFLISDSALYVLDPSQQTNQIVQLNKLLHEQGGQQIVHKNYYDIRVAPASKDILLTTGSYDNSSNSIFIKISAATVERIKTDFSTLDPNTVKASTYDPDTFLFSALSSFQFNGASYILATHRNTNTTLFSIYRETDLELYASASRQTSLRNITISAIDYFDETEKFFMITDAGLWSFSINNIRQSSVTVKLSHE